MKPLLRLLFRHAPGLIVLAIVAGAVSGACNAGLLALINVALHHRDPAETRWLARAFAALALLLPVARAGSSFLLSLLGQRAVLGLRLELSRKVIAAPLRRLEEVGASRLLVVLTDDIANIVVAITALPMLVIQLAVLAGCLLYLGSLSWTALAGVAALLAVSLALYQLPVSRAMRHQRIIRGEADQLYEHFRSVTQGVKELKLHRERRDALLAELDATGRRLRRSGVIASTLFSAAAGWGQVVLFAIVALVVFVLPGVQPVGLETLTGYALILLYMATPLEVILNTIPVLGRASVAFRTVESLGLSLRGAAPPPVPAGPAALQASRDGWRTLELAGVTHAYRRDGEPDAFVLGPVDLVLRGGETVFLIGGNGSGKTTLAKLILGLYAPESGEVRVDGRPVTDADRDEHLQRFSAVFSDFFLFERLLGLRGPGLDGEAAHYLRQLRLEHEVRVEDGRLSRTALSQGQRKRLALLTAYLEDRSTYVFDEWAADQDPVFRDLFYHELLPQLRARGKTLLVITHDDRYFGVADRIVKLDCGRVEYDGDPDGYLAGGHAFAAPRPRPAAERA